EREQDLAAAELATGAATAAGAVAAGAGRRVDLAAGDEGSTLDGRLLERADVDRRPEQHPREHGHGPDGDPLAALGRLDVVRNRLGLLHLGLGGDGSRRGG